MGRQFAELKTNIHKVDCKVNRELSMVQKEFGTDGTHLTCIDKHFMDNRNRLIHMEANVAIYQPIQLDDNAFLPTAVETSADLVLAMET